MRSKSALLTFLGLVALTLVVGAHAKTPQDASIKLKEPVAVAGSPGEARFKARTEYASIDMLCLHIYFDAADPLDPGDGLLFSPASLLPMVNGPGMFNVSPEPQYFRSICNVSYEGDIFLPPFLDGKETFLLVAEVGSVRIDRIDVEVFGTPAG